MRERSNGEAAGSAIVLEGEMRATSIFAMTDDGVLVTADAQTIASGALTIASVMIDTIVVSGRTEARADTNVTTTDPGQTIRPERD